MKQFQMDGWVTKGNVATRSTATGKQVTSFSVNSPERRKNQQTGEWDSVPMFFNCQYWHRSDRDFRAAAIVPGAHLVMVGEPRYESWEKDGQKRSKVTLNVRGLWEVKPREEAQGGSYAPQRPTQPEACQASVYDEDIPF